MEHIQAQQQDLDLHLTQYSTQIKAFLEKNPKQTTADEDREKAYGLAEVLNSKLDDMQNSLSVVIQELNLTKTKSDTPVGNIVEVLNMHLGCLEWIEERNNSLEGKLESLRQKSQDIGAWR